MDYMAEYSLPFDKLRDRNNDDKVTGVLILFQKKGDGSFSPLRQAQGPEK